MDTPKNSKSRPPSFQFYPSDWLNDAKLQICSLKSLGVLINLMCLMHEGDPYGYLSVNGRKMSPKEVQKLAKIGSKSYNFCTSELLQNGVLKCDETYGLFCERMVKDHRLRTIRKESGLKGGNPNLVNQNEKSKDKQIVNQNPTPSSSTSFSPSDINPPSPQGGVWQEELNELKEKWNKIKFDSPQKNPSVQSGVPIMRSCRITNEKIEKRFRELRKRYELAEIINSVVAYAKDIANRKKTDGYEEHRFHFQEFVCQSNGLEKFIIST